MVRQQIISFIDYMGSDAMLKLIGVWFITLILASSFNNYRNGWYPSGYCFLSVRIPTVLSCILFLFPYKRKISIGLILLQFITYIYAIIYIALYINKIPLSIHTQELVLNVHMILSLALIGCSFVDSLFHTDDKTRQPKDSRLSQYFRHMGWLQ